MQKHQHYFKLECLNKNIIKKQIKNNYQGSIVIIGMVDSDTDLKSKPVPIMGNTVRARHGETDFGIYCLWYL